MAARIRKDDEVIVIAGKDKGKTGKVLRILAEEGRAIVQGVHMVTRHTRPTNRQAGGLVEKEGSIHLSNLAHIDPKTRRPTRVGFRVVEGERKVRFARRSGDVIDR